MAAGPFAPDEQTLFLVHFDKDVIADHAKGEKDYLSGYSAITTGNGGKFGEGLVVGRDTLAKNSEAKNAYSPTAWPWKGNLNLKEGTVEFWVKFDLFREGGKDGRSLYYLFDLPTGVSGDDGNIIRVVIVLTDVYGKQTLYAFPGKRPPAGKTQWPALGVAVAWEKGEWHHVALAWTPEQAVLFVDGKKGPQVSLTDGLFSGDTSAVSTLEEFFLIGGLWKSDVTQCPEGVMDEFRISSNARYTDDFDPAQ